MHDEIEGIDEPSEKIRDFNRKIRHQWIILAVMAFLFVMNLAFVIMGIARPPKNTLNYFNLILNSVSTVVCLYAMLLGLKTLKTRYRMKLEQKIQEQLDDALPEGVLRYRSLEVVHAFRFPEGWNGITKHYVLMRLQEGACIGRIFAKDKGPLSLQIIELDDYLASLYKDVTKSKTNTIRMILDCIQLPEVMRIIQANYSWSDDFGVLASAEHLSLVDRYQTEAAFNHWADRVFVHDDAPQTYPSLHQRLRVALARVTESILERGTLQDEVPSSVLNYLVTHYHESPAEEVITLYRWIRAVLDWTEARFGDDDGDDWLEVNPSYLLSRYGRLSGLRDELFSRQSAYPGILQDVVILLLQPFDMHDPERIYRYNDEMIKGYHHLFGTDQSMKLFPSKTRIFLENDLGI